MTTVTTKILPETGLDCQTPADVDDFVTYLRNVLETISTVDAAVPVPCTSSDVGERVFERIARKPFCYLSRKRSAAYREDFVARANEFAGRDEPVRLFYDIGAGYHASLDPGVEPLSFSPGLGELLMLYQIARFNRDVQTFYAPGVRFTLVIDNLLAHYVNDIPVEPTIGYCTELRQLINETHMSERVDLLVESEVCETEVYAQLIAQRPKAEINRFEISAAQHRNVSRFLGYACPRSEAIERMARYQLVTPVSDRILNEQVDSVRLTQRATPGTMAFRPHPGGDSRIQAGEVALFRNRYGKVRPMLLTSENIESFDYSFHKFESLPLPLPHIRIATQRSIPST